MAALVSKRAAEENRPHHTAYFATATAQQAEIDFFVFFLAQKQSKVFVQYAEYLFIKYFGKKNLDNEREGTNPLRRIPQESEEDIVLFLTMKTVFEAVLKPIRRLKASTTEKNLPKPYDGKFKSHSYIKVN